MRARVIGYIPLDRGSPTKTRLSHLLGQYLSLSILFGRHTASYCMLIRCFNLTQTSREQKLTLTGSRDSMRLPKHSTITTKQSTIRTWKPVPFQFCATFSDHALLSSSSSQRKSMDYARSSFNSTAATRTEPRCPSASMDLISSFIFSRSSKLTTD